MKHSVQHVDFLDHFRGIAIIAVLLVHTLLIVYGYSELPWNGLFRDIDAPISYLCFLPVSFGSAAGVAIFFVVSGFCIHMSFQKQGQKWGGFFTRRFFRIYPPYLAALIFSMLLIWAYTPWSAFYSPGFWRQLLTHLFLIHNSGYFTFTAINVPFWSLAVEAQLYLLYPVLLVLVSKLGWRRTMIILAGCELLLRGTHGLIKTVGATDPVRGILLTCYTACRFITGSVGRLALLSLMRI